MTPTNMVIFMKVNTHRVYKSHRAADPQLRSDVKHTVSSFCFCCDCPPFTRCSVPGSLHRKTLPLRAANPCMQAYVAPSTSKPAPQMDPQYAAPSVVAAAAPPPATAPPADAAPPAPLPPPAPAFSVPATAVLPVSAFSVPAPAGFEYIGCDVCRRWRIVSTSDIESNQVLITTLT